MRKFLSKFFAVIFILGWLMTSSGFLHAETGAKTVSSSESKLYFSHELLIQFKAGAELKSSLFRNSKTASGNPKLDSLNSRYMLQKIVPLSSLPADTSISIESGITTQTYLFKFEGTSSLKKLKQTMILYT